MCSHGRVTLGWALCCAALERPGPWPGVVVAPPTPRGERGSGKGVRMDSSSEMRTRQSLGMKHRLEPSSLRSNPRGAPSHEALGPLSLSFPVWGRLGARAGLVGWEPLSAGGSRASLLSVGRCGK